MPIRLLSVLVAILTLQACMAQRSVPVEEPPMRPLPSGITPLTVEQDDQLGS